MDWLLRFDLEAFRTIHVRLASPVLDWVMTALSYSGLGQVQALASLAMLLSPRTRRFTVPLLITIVISGLVVAQGIKRLMPRDRPSLLSFSQPQELWVANSFPSGHTTTSFAVAAMILLLTWKSKDAWMGWVGLVWAALVGVSRVYRGVHWPTDVIGGMFAGMASAAVIYLVLDAFGKITPGEERPSEG